MKRTLLFLSLVLSAAFTFAQNPASHDMWIDRPDLIIKGDDLKNFPGGQLSEMLIGRLPGLDHINTANQETKMIFIVDGFLWTSIDAININNIEEIAYYRGGLNTKLDAFQQNLNGVISITTKTAKFKQPLSLDVNTILGANLYKEDLIGKKRRSLQSYNVSLSQGFDKFSWRASVVYNSATRNLTGFDFTHQYQMNGAIKFSPLKWLDLSLNANYAPSNGDSPEKRSVSPTLTQLSKTNYKQNDLNGTFNMKISPLKGLLNETAVFKNKVKADADKYVESYITAIKGYYAVNADSVSNKTNNFSVINNLSYRFAIADDKIKFKAGTTFQYNDNEYKLDEVNGRYSAYVDQPRGSISLSRSFSNVAYKSYTFVGDLSANLFDILSVQAGIRKDKYAKSDYKRPYASYYYGDLNLKNAFLKDIKEINQLLFFASYGQQASETNSMIVNGNNSTPSIENVAYLTLGSNPKLKEEMDKMKTQSYGIKTAFFDNRLQLSGDWYKNSNHSYFIIESLVSAQPQPRYTYLYFPYRGDYSGWRVWAQGDLLRNSPFKWSTGLNFFINKSKIDYLSDEYMVSPSQDIVLKPATQAGMQQNLYYANFSLNMNASAYFDHQTLKSERVSGKEVFSVENSTFINLNYLSIGYDFRNQLAGKKLKNLNVGLVTRNLIQAKKKVEDNVLSKSVAVALNARF